MANIKRKNNFISALSNETETVTNHQEKHRLIFEHFRDHIGSCSQRKHLLNYEQLGWQPHQLQHLDLPFTEQEVEKNHRGQMVSLEHFSEFVGTLSKLTSWQQLDSFISSTSRDYIY
jgi:hypothetical protein